MLRADLASLQRHARASCTTGGSLKKIAEKSGHTAPPATAADGGRLLPLVASRLTPGPVRSAKAVLRPAIASSRAIALGDPDRVGVRS